MSVPQTYLRERCEDVERTDGVGDSASGLPVVVAKETMELLEPLGRVQDAHFAGRVEGISARGPEPQATMRLLPGARRTDVEPARHGVSDLDRAVAAVVWNPEESLDERVRVAGFDAGLRQKAHEPQRRVYADTANSRRSKPTTASP